MQIIEPTKKEVFEALKIDGCTWCGGYGCECHSKINMPTCFDIAKKQLTRDEYTESEIEEMKNKTNDADEASDEFW